MAYISENIAEFRDTMNVLSLAKATAQILKQRRTSELMYGIYCGLFYRPSSVLNQIIDDELKDFVAGFRGLDLNSTYLHRSQLVDKFKKNFAIDCLPADFSGAVTEGIALVNESLIIGEYAVDSARIAVVTSDACTINDYYNQVKGVRHIHAISPKRQDIYVTTGDSRKLLDLWAVEGNRLKFLKRIRKRLSGYTAMVELNGDYYFGTDFSNRPNYIETLSGKKYFFPEKAYKMQTHAFFPFLQRYIVSINREIFLGDRKTLCVFDTLKEDFIFCDYLDCLLESDMQPGKIKNKSGQNRLLWRAGLSW